MIISKIYLCAVTISTLKNNVELIIDTSTDFYFVEVEIETLSAVEF